MRIADAGLEPEPAAPGTLLLLLGRDKQRIFCVHVKPAQPFIGLRRGKDAGKAAYIPEKVVAVPVIRLTDQRRALVPEAVKDQSALGAHSFLNGIAVAGRDDIACAGAVQHAAQLQGFHQVFPEAAVQGLLTQAADQYAREHEINIRIDHALHRLCGAEHVLQNLPEVMPAHDIEGIPVQDGGGMRQEMEKGNALQAPAHELALPDLREQLFQGILKPHPAFPHQHQDLGGGGDLGQARHVKQRVFLRVAHADAGKGTFPVKHAHAGGGEIARRSVPLREIPDRPGQFHTSFFRQHLCSFLFAVCLHYIPPPRQWFSCNAFFVFFD